MTTERRSAVRQRAFLKAIVWYNSKAASIGCTVRDISDGGARLVLASELPIPVEFDLEIPSRDQETPARIVWRNGREIGVAFGHVQESAPKGDLESRVAHLEQEIDKLRRALGKVRTDLLRSIGDRDLTTE